MKKEAVKLAGYKEIKELLQTLVSIPSPSGFEDKLVKFWTDYISKYCNKAFIDSSGNGIAQINKKKGENDLLIIAHCDNVGLMVKTIIDGYIYFDTIGNFTTRFLEGQKVKILTQNKIIDGVIGTVDDKDKSLKTYEFWIDIGNYEYLKYIKPGDPIVFDNQPTLINDNWFSSPGLDNKVGIVILTQLIKNICENNININLIGALTVREEINSIGSITIAKTWKSKKILILDTSYSSDYPETDPRILGDIRCGGGPVITKGSFLDKLLISELENVANSINIPLQYEVYPNLTYSDADGVYSEVIGTPIAVLGIPVRYMHSSVEMVNLMDIKYAIDLLLNWINP